MEFIGFILLILAFSAGIGIMLQDAFNMYFEAKEEMEEEYVTYDYSPTKRSCPIYTLTDWCEKKAQ